MDCSNSNLKWFLILLKLSCFAAFLAQMTLSVYYQADPTETVAKTEKIKLEDISFPVALKICFQPGLKLDEIEKVGYEDAWWYFAGQSKHDSTKFGWAGHTKNGTVLSNVSDIQKRIFQDYHSMIVSSNAYVYTINQTIDYGRSVPKQDFQLRRPNYPDNCLTLDLAKFVKQGEKFFKLSIVFNRSGFANSIDIYIEDRLMIVNRPNYYSFNLPLHMEELNKNWTKRFLVSIKQNIFLEKEFSKCENYPTSEFTSYEDCDNQQLENGLKQEVVFPAWATPKDLSRATKWVDTRNGFSQFIYYYFTGRYSSLACLDPCTQTSIQSVLKLTGKTVVGGVSSPTISLDFHPLVEMTVHSFPVFQPLVVLQDLGSSLGLWLGLGVLQVRAGGWWWWWW